MDTTSSHLTRILECFPDLQISKVDLNPDGLVNDILIVNDELVFRFPKHERARQMLVQEGHILTLVRRYASLPVPVFERQEQDFAMYRFLPGEALHQDDLLRQDQRAQEHLAEQLGTFLQQLHSIPHQAIEQAGISQADSARSREDWLALYRLAEREMFPLLMAHSREWVTRLFTPILDGSLGLDCSPALIHGDLGPYHILYDRVKEQISGVIDFGTGGLGDPADDFANIINGLGEGFLRQMGKYHPGIRDSLERARFHAGTLEIQWALNGLRTGDPSWFLVHLGRARELGPRETGDLL